MIRGCACFFLLFSRALGATADGGDVYDSPNARGALVLSPWPTSPMLSELLPISMEWFVPSFLSFSPLTHVLCDL